MRESSAPSRVALLVSAVAVCTQFAYVFSAGLSSTARAASPPALASCLASTKGGKPAGSWRDCGPSVGPLCSLAQPCTPCNETGLALPCATCASPFAGACNFLEGFGPYCAFAGGVAPCEKCCL